MAFSDVYHNQVSLLMRTLPYVAEESCFALKGGTAINLFIRNLPRLSVDIDLTYLPVMERGQSLLDIDTALKNIGKRIRKADNSIHITESAPRSQNEITKLVVRTKERVQIKIEVTPVLRGCVYDSVNMEVSQKTEDKFGFAEINVLSFADIYAGKIMAAFDRQHPRDLFDVHQLLENEGITDDLRTAIIVYLISHDHSPHSLLAPVLKDISQDYEQNFVGMTTEDIMLDTLLETREKLITDVVGNMPDNHKEFLRSFYRRKPDWKLLGIDGVENLPAVRWRELNLDKSGDGTCEELLRKLEAVITS
ncbi:MAG: nucleotidyl transferase AbiEii/AbiGii toxin family protein [Pseudomonadales bacterium]|nr:nucleotidyl transferase AbiEii/AbiGii toxin family protein [Pseudomonadales bacterium]